MTDRAIALWKSAASAFDARHSMAAPEQMGLPTPCDGFDVEDLIAHVVGVQASFAGYLGADAEGLDCWPEARAVMESQLQATDVLEGWFDHPALGRLTKQRALEIATNDMLIHAWDLSRALGVDDDLPAENLEPAIEGIEAFPPPVREVLFAAPVEVPADATTQERLLGFAGRVR